MGSDPTRPNVRIETTTGHTEPKPLTELTLEDLLALQGLPGNLFQAYTRGEGQSSPVPIDTPLARVGDCEDVVLRCIMNPNFSEFVPVVETRHGRDDAVTTIKQMNFGVEGAESVVHELDPSAARAVVSRRVESFTRLHRLASRTVIGVSGGGDSNALIAPLSAAAHQAGSELVAFTLVAEPLWPEASAERAAVICSNHGVRHEVLDGTRTADLLGLSDDVTDLYGAFLDEFGDMTSHFLATYLISTAARALGRELGASDYALGFNREDVLAEFLFSMMNGRPPLQFPVRQFGEHRLIMPVWEVPKTVLDACYPDYSLTNYEHRIPTTPQRGLIYFLAHSLEGLYPNFGLSLLRGAQRWWDGGWPSLERDGVADFYPDPSTDEATRARARTFLTERLSRARGGP